MYAQHDGGLGDAVEFDDVYARFRPRLVRYCRRRLGDAGDAEDAAHEALLRAFQAWGRFDRSSDAWPWLSTIAARVCTDMRRRALRPPADRSEQPVADVHDLAAARLRASILDDALGELPPRYRNPLVLKEFAGWTYRDIAELEGRSVSAVRSNIMRSRRHLGARVEEVARSQRAWPLPAAVPELAGRAHVRTRRMHGIRLWLERLAQTAAAVFDSSLLLGAFTTPAAQAFSALGGVMAATVLAVSVPTAAATPPRATPATATAALSVDTTAPPSAQEVAVAVTRTVDERRRNVRTVARFDPGIGGSGKGPAQIGEAIVTFEREEHHMVIQVRKDYLVGPMQANDTPHTSRIGCTKNAVRRAACATVETAVTELSRE